MTLMLSVSHRESVLLFQIKRDTMIPGMNTIPVRGRLILMWFAECKNRGKWNIVLLLS